MRALFVPAIAAAVLAGCSAFGPDETEFIIKADSVTVPGAWPGGLAMTAKVYATVGPDLCWRFKEFRIARDTLGARVTILGAHADAAKGCRQMVAVMDGTELTLAPPLRDPFELRIVQPDGTELKRTIRME